MIKKILVTMTFMFLITGAIFASDFKDRIYVVRNPKSNVEIVANGEGKILDRTFDAYYDSLGLCVDAKTGESNYYFKVDGSHMEGMDGPENSICTFYDKNGNEVGLSKEDIWGSQFTFGKYIGIAIYGRDTNSNKLILFDTEEKKEIEAPLPEANYFGGRVVFSGNTYDDGEKKILVCDDDFNVIKTIDGYSTLNVTNIDDKKVLRIARKNPDDDKGRLIENYLDENFNFLYDPETEMKKYNEVEDKYNYYDPDYDEKYNAATISMIKKMDEKLEYIYSTRSNDKTIFIANYPIEDYDTQRDSISNVYTPDLTKSLSKVVVESVDEKNGYIFVDYDKVYDFDLNLIKKFDRKSYIQTHEKFDKKYYVDEFTEGIQRRDTFDVYDSNFNVVFKDISNFDEFSFDDYIVVTDNDGTKLYDKNMKVVEKFDRKFMLYSWYSDKYLVFRDRDTDRMGIMDRNYNIMIDKLKYVESLKDDYFSFQNGFRYGIMDYKGNIIISFSIFDTMKEDAKEDDYRLGYVNEEEINN